MLSEKTSARPLGIQNTNRWTTRQLVTVALMCALSALLQFIELPIMPAASFLKYDASFVPAMVSGFAAGPVAGVVVGVLATLIHTLFDGNWVGGLMNVICCLAYVIPASLIYRKLHSLKGALLGLGVAVVCVIVAAVAANLTIGVWFWYGSADAILPLVFPVLIPFNLIKAGLNSALTILVYKAVSKFISPLKEMR